MDESNRILNCDATSLLNLKAELYRKQEACKLAKSHQNFGPLKRMAIKGQSIVTKKKEKSSPKTTETLQDSHEEEEILKQSRKILEAKAKLYDEIIEKKVALDQEFSDSYLVDFQRKELFEQPTNNMESVVKPDKKIDACDHEEVVLPNEHISSEDLESLNTEFTINNSLDVDDQRFCASNNHQQEKVGTADNHTADGPVHYQNVQFNEIRDHGVGYFAFSQEEKERQKQMDLLKTLRQETMENKQAKTKLKQKKQASLELRLAKVCQRRNIDSSLLQAYTKKEENEQEMEPKQIPDDSPPDHSSTTEATSDTSPLSKKVRPWDIGKSGFDFPAQKSKNKQSGAEKWLEHKREERNKQFAPPSFYFDNQEPKAKKLCQDNSYL